MRPCIYILASRRNGTLYVGVTGSLPDRLWQHRSGIGSEFVRKYQIYALVYVEPHATMAAAILREKQIKKWRRAWKLQLMEAHNPRWRDLTEDLIA